MAKTSFNLFMIDTKYVRKLQNIDRRVMSVSPQTGKENRPFLGVIVICNCRKYCIPLSTPKKKHATMRNRIDFKKIIYNGEFLSVINYNLMIPVEYAQIKQIDTKIRKHDGTALRKRKKHLQKELNWCNAHISEITNSANVLYKKYISGENFSARAQCLDFLQMEVACDRYNAAAKK